MSDPLLIEIFAVVAIIGGLLLFMYIVIAVGARIAAKAIRWATARDDADERSG